MSHSSKSAPFNATHYTDSMWQAMDQLRESFDKRVGTRMGRGDVRTSVLALLGEQPMHGYQIIREIETRTDGRWKPSAGSVYPTLQLLADEGLISAEEKNGRKTYTLTEDGRLLVDQDDVSAPWEDNESPPHHKFSPLPKAGMELGQAVGQVGRTGTPDQIQEAVAILEETRRRMYSILAQD